VGGLLRFDLQEVMGWIETQRGRFNPPVDKDTPEADR